MSLVCLVSGGLDSTVMTVLAVRRRLDVHPVFVDYSQRAAAAEWKACTHLAKRFKLPLPQRIDLRDFGRAVPSGLTTRRLRVKEDAFLPGRNLLFLLVGASIASSINANGVAIGLLREKDSLFPDQTELFLDKAQDIISLAYGRALTIVAPLMTMSKADVIVIAAELGVDGTYSCHTGADVPCGECISCLEFRSSR